MVIALSGLYLSVVILMSIGVILNWHKDNYIVTIARTAPCLLAMVFAVSILLWPLTMVFWISDSKENR